METFIVTTIEYFPYILVGIFGLLGCAVKKVRITCFIILTSALVNIFMQNSYDELAMSGKTIGLLVMGGMDMTAAMVLLIFHANPNAEKAPQQAVVFVLGMACHGILAIEVFSKQYLFYDVYDYAMWGLIVAHILVMGGYYEECYKNIKEVLARRSIIRYSRGAWHWLARWKLRDNSVDSSSGHRRNGGLSIRPGHSHETKS